MNPKRPPSSREMTALLAQLRKTSQGYPPDLLAARRSRYLKQVADSRISAHGLNGKVLSTLKSGVTSTLEVALQTVLGVMVAGLVVTVAILYREEIVDFFTPGNGGVVASEVAPVLPPSTPTPEWDLQETPTTLIHKSTAKTPTASATPTQTTRLENPTEKPGLHLGQTPTPPAKRKTPKP